MSRFPQRSAAQAVRKTTDATFAFDVLRAAGPVLVDFYADWCPTCRRLGAVLDDLVEALDGQATVVKVDVEAHTALADRFDVRRIPTLVLFDGGVERARIAEVAKVDRILDALTLHLESSRTIDVTE